MSLLIRDRSVSRRLIAKRRSLGLDRYDEVWNGVYVMSPLPNNEHQALAFELGSVVREVVPNEDGTIFATCDDGVDIRYDADGQSYPNEYGTPTRPPGWVAD